MKVAVTGAGGFLGARLADALLAAGEASPLGPIRELLLTDVAAPPPRRDPRARCLAVDLTAPGAADALLAHDLHVLFHLAAVVSGHAEEDLELGLRVNLDATRALLEAARRRAPRLRLVFSSTVGVFGGELPPLITERTATTPQNSYGTAKAMSELLIADYTRRGLVDGRVVRLPTVTVRAAVANRAVTSFASGVVREPLAGLEAVCPVAATQRLWVCSPGAAVRNLVHAAALGAGAWGASRLANLPGLAVSAGQMVQALAAVAGPQAAARVRFEPDEAISRMVATFPVEFDNTRALSLGFEVDSDFEEIIRDYIREDLKGSYSQ